MSRLVRRLTGGSLDRISSQLGLITSYRLKYGSIEILPVPMIKMLRSAPISQVNGEFSGESVTKWTVSLPMGTLSKLFPTEADWRTAIEANQPWLVTMPDSDIFVPVITEGSPLSGERGRYVITLAAIGFED